jgi:hypothetical protein
MTPGGARNKSETSVSDADEDEAAPPPAAAPPPDPPGHDPGVGTDEWPSTAERPSSPRATPPAESAVERPPKTASDMAIVLVADTSMLPGEPGAIGAPTPSHPLSLPACSRRRAAASERERVPLESSKGASGAAGVVTALGAAGAATGTGPPDAHSELVVRTVAAGSVPSLGSGFPVLPSPG